MNFLFLSASSTLCNLLLEFSPSKEPILDSGAIDLLCQLTHKYDPSLRLNGVWGLMVSTPPRPSEISMNNLGAMVKPVLTPHLRYESILKV